ncbi:putative salutaridine reductase (NADPH) [Helianthus anomalus]
MKIETLQPFCLGLLLLPVETRDGKRGVDAVSKLHFFRFTGHYFRQLDVTDPASITSLANFFYAYFGKLDTFVRHASCFEICI